MGDTNFQPIFDYIDEAEKRLKEELLEEMATKKGIEKVLAAIGKIATSTKDNGDDILVLENKTENLEHWAIAAAEKVDVPNKP